MIVAIDGPAGSGKSTTARAVAQALGFTYLDTGAMYRAIALAFLRAQLTPDEQSAHDVLRDLQVEITYIDGEQHVLVDGEDVSGLIRTPEVGAMSSLVSSLSPVRIRMVEEQRRFARQQIGLGRGVVIDGRDIGTYVFPDADVKVYMVAEAEERARRRHRELTERGSITTHEDVLNDLLRRDKQDSGRALAPLRRAEDAINIDTTRHTVDEQVNLVIQLVKERKGITPV